MPPGVILTDIEAQILLNIENFWLSTHTMIPIHLCAVLCMVESESCSPVIEDKPTQASTRVLRRPSICETRGNGVHTLTVCGGDVDWAQSEISMRRDLTSLQMEDVYMKELPSAIVASMHDLTRLVIIKSSLETVPEALGRLESIRHINLRRNRITGLPVTFKAFKGKGIKLYLEGNNIADEGDGSFLGKRELRKIFEENVFFGSDSSR